MLLVEFARDVGCCENSGNGILLLIVLELALLGAKFLASALAFGTAILLEIFIVGFYEL